MRQPGAQDGNLAMGTADCHATTSLARRFTQRGAGPDTADEQDAQWWLGRDGEIAMLAHLTYRAASDELTERTVLITRVTRRSGVLYLGGHCHLRDAPRSFRADRIETLANGRTGEIVPDPQGFLAGLAREGAPLKAVAPGLWSRAQLREVTRPPAILLMRLARADRWLVPEETALIGEMIARYGRHRPVRDEDRAALLAEYTALVPSGNLETRALKAIAAEPALHGDLPGWCRRMIEADGATRPEEVVAFRQIVARLAALSG